MHSDVALWHCAGSIILSFVVWLLTYCTVWPEVGNNPRRPIAQKERNVVRKEAELGLAKQCISQKARDYLVNWITETRRRQARPAKYDFLEHRLGARGNGIANRNPHEVGPLRPVVVLRAAGQVNALPQEEEEEEEVIADDNRPCEILE